MTQYLVVNNFVTQVLGITNEVKGELLINHEVRCVYYGSFENVHSHDEKFNSLY
jgi:hypothetical protein